MRKGSTKRGERAKEVAETIRQQMGVFGLGVVGASDLAFAEREVGALTFNARLHRKGQSRVRKARVYVTLTAMDAYDITVEYQGEVTEVATNVYADDLVKTMYALDSDGF